jgi:hypothetical protein
LSDWKLFRNNLNFFSSGARMPLGQLIPNSQLKKRYSYRNYNEYIVYDESQVALRYLVQFRR